VNLRADEQLLVGVAKQVGCQVVSAVFKPPHVHFTHVIVGGQNPKSPKVALGIARRAWIVSADWLLACVDKGKLVDENRFELAHVPGARVARKSAAPPLSGFRVCVQGDTAPPRHELECIVTSAGGVLVNAAKDAQLCVAARSAHASQANKSGCLTMTDAKFMAALFSGRIAHGL
jgi:hypothetical protein